MAYVPKYVLESKVISKINNPRIKDISDDDMESGEFRLELDLADPQDPIGKSVSVSDLYACDRAYFEPLVEQAAMYAIISELNSAGKVNYPVGPITSVSGDGMAKTHGYYSGKTVSNNSLVTAEEKYSNIVNRILRLYKGRCIGNKKVYARTNEVYELGYDINNWDERRSEGNPRVTSE